MTLLFLAGIYFFARGVFALYGQTIFYTKRVLENIEEKDIPAYLKEIGWIFPFPAVAPFCMDGC